MNITDTRIDALLATPARSASTSRQRRLSLDRQRDARSPTRATPASSTSGTTTPTTASRQRLRLVDQAALRRARAYLRGPNLTSATRTVERPDQLRLDPLPERGGRGQHRPRLRRRRRATSSTRPRTTARPRAAQPHLEHEDGDLRRLQREAALPVSPTTRSWPAARASSCAGHRLAIENTIITGSGDALLAWRASRRRRRRAQQRARDDAPAARSSAGPAARATSPPTARRPARARARRPRRRRRAAAAPDFAPSPGTPLLDAGTASPATGALRRAATGAPTTTAAPPPSAARASWIPPARRFRRPAGRLLRAPPARARAPWHRRACGCCRARRTPSP